MMRIGGDIELIDVTIPLQFHVNSSMLQMLEQRKRDQIGFMNPLLDMYKEPYLYIAYSYKGNNYDILLPESTPLQLPITP